MKHMSEGVYGGLPFTRACLASLVREVVLMDVREATLALCNCVSVNIALYPQFQLQFLLDSFCNYNYDYPLPLLFPHHLPIALISPQPHPPPVPPTLVPSPCTTSLTPDPSPNQPHPHLTLHPSISPPSSPFPLHPCKPNHAPLTSSFPTATHKPSSQLPPKRESDKTFGRHRAKFVSQTRLFRVGNRNQLTCWVMGDG